MLFAPRRHSSHSSLRLTEMVYHLKSSYGIYGNPYYMQKTLYNLTGTFIDPPCQVRDVQRTEKSQVLNVVKCSPI